MSLSTMDAVGGAWIRPATSTTFSTSVQFGMQQGGKQALVFSLTYHLEVSRFSACSSAWFPGLPEVQALELAGDTLW
eukprot:5403180-Amphidinium_carterae.1